MAASNLDVIKDVPGYKVILKAVLKTQIQLLVEQLATHTDEESVILTASVADGTLSHLGSDSGKSFLDDNEEVKSQFLGFCLKRHHREKQLEKEREREREREQERERLQAAQAQLSMSMPRRGAGRSMFPRHSTPRHAPYPMTRPSLDRRPSGDFIPQGSEQQGMQQVLDNQGSGIKLEGMDNQGEFSDNERSNSSSSVPAETSGVNMGDGGDDGVSVKKELVESELDLEITGVEVGGVPGVSPDDWGANVSMGMNFDPSLGATGTSADMAQGQGQQAYTIVGTDLSTQIHQCPVCERAFNRRYNLSVHMRVHTGEKPFQCQTCSKKFTTKQACQVHMATHLAEPTK